MRIDTHSHVVTPSYLRALTRHSGDHPELQKVTSWITGPAIDAGIMDLPGRVEAMDAVQMDVSVLSLPPPSTFFDDPGLAAETARQVNDELLATAASFPGRFVVLGCVPLPHLDEAVGELERIAGHPLMRGLGLVTTLHRWSLDDRRLRPFFARAAELGLPVVLHPAMETLHPCFSDWGLAASLGTLTSSTVGVVRMALSGLFDEVPDLVPIVPHLGGTLPYVVARVAQAGQGDNELDLLDFCRTRLYVDNCSSHLPALRCALDVVGPGRIMLGSDFPGRGASLSRCIDDVVASGLDARDQANILGVTASRWFSPAGPVRR
jgi:aminocarboxymuconate-semialdehyde decarboxylase